ncbi:MAG: hypothetical protein JW882_15860 [Deltaproteobacteria bacterium]|nr:hypothetical protein [Deltaproteobacteria bacterium]
MRKEKKLIGILSGLVDLLVEESERNPEFATRLDRILSDLPKRKTVSKRRAKKPPLPKQLPDIYAEWNARGEMEFRLWMREQPIIILRAIIRTQDFDSTHRTTKWKEAEKLADYITDNLRARLLKGSAFIRIEATE